jgi:predicted amidohydrolase
MAGTVTIAGVQMEPRIFEKDANLHHAVNLATEAASAGARLIILPEAALTGYCFSSLNEAKPLAEAIPGPSTDVLSELCQELNIFLIIGMIEVDGDDYYNVAAFIGPEGVVGRYRKIHLPYLGLDRFVTPGNEPFRVYDTAIGRVGISICYDANFPESARIMAISGADIIALPTNWPQGRETIPSLVVPTRAFENRVFFAAVDRVGEERGFRFLGNSTIAAPTGEILTRAGPIAEETIYAEVDLEQARRKHVVIKPGEFEIDPIGHRRPELYGDLASPSKGTD